MKIINFKSEKDVKKCAKSKVPFMANLMLYRNDIKPNMFEGVEHITFVLSSSDTKIVGKRAFANCWELQRFDGLPEVIDEEAFTFCKSLKDFNFSTIHNLSPSAFSFSGLQQIELPPHIKNIPEKCFQACLKLRNLNLNQIEHIEDEAFQSSGLRVLNIPISLEYIGQKSFEGCVYLSDIVCERFIPPRIHSSTFYSCSLKNIWVFSEAQLNEYLKDRYWSRFSGLYRIAKPKVLKQRMEEIRLHKDSLWSV